ncbi:unnamed protein product, partial [Prorocentrum cordatum]
AGALPRADLALLEELSGLLLAASAAAPRPPTPERCITTVLTDASGRRVNVAARVRQPSACATVQEAPVAVCLWSDLPEALSPGFLGELAGLAADCSGAPTPAALARLCAWLVWEVPAPPCGVGLWLHGPRGAVGLVRGALEGMPRSHVRLQALPARLGARELVTLTRLVLLEQRVVLCSSSAAVLTDACEALSRVLLFPLAWRGRYAPLLLRAGELQGEPSRGAVLAGLLRHALGGERGRARPRGAATAPSSTWTPARPTSRLAPSSCLSSRRRRAGF